MKKLFYTCPIESAYMAMNFGVKFYIIQYGMPSSPLEDWEILNGIAFGEDKIKTLHIHPDSLLVFDNMPDDKKQALIVLGLWPQGYGYKEIPLTRGNWAKVDESDYEELSKYTWHCSSDGYANRAVAIAGKSAKQIGMHRHIMQPAKGMYVDHINGDKADNRRSNLRIVTNSQNSMNRKPRITTTSQCKGVSYHKRDKTWRANICLDQKKIYIGCYKTEVEAAEAYNIKAIELFGKHARLNDIDYSNNKPFIMPEVESV